MALKWDDTTRTAQADAWEAAIGASPKLQFWSGAVPTSAAATPAGTKIVEHTLGADWTADTDGWIKTLAGLPLAVTGLPAAGTGTTATFYRFVTSGGTCREQGEIGSDMTIDNASIANGQTVNITAFTKTWPGA